MNRNPEHPDHLPPPPEFEEIPAAFEQKLRGARAVLSPVPHDLRAVVLTGLGSPEPAVAAPRPERARRWRTWGLPAALAACWAITGLLSLQTKGILASVQPVRPTGTVPVPMQLPAPLWRLEEDDQLALGRQVIHPPAPRESKRGSLLRRAFHVRVPSFPV